VNQKTEGRRQKAEAGGRKPEGGGRKAEDRRQKTEGRKLVFVALGSNQGDSVELIRKAIEQLQQFSDEPLHQSSLWQTPPVDCPPGSPDFLNAVVALTSLADETPETLLGKLQSVEKEFGRRPKKVLNEPRPLDLDLIAFGNETRATGKLILPHPRAHLRRFVLQPLAEIAPDLILPGQTKTVQQLLEELPREGAIRKLD
jgi:2-amino-4-hydroxy-6-hydroxymethyldihydropteridine diphosphokinase